VAAGNAARAERSRAFVAHRFGYRDDDDEDGERNQRAPHQCQRARAVADEHPDELRGNAQGEQERCPRGDDLTLQARAQIRAADERDKNENARPIPSPNPGCERAKDERKHGRRDGVDERRDPQHARRVSAAP
jgi:hypothetical protein